MYKKIASKTSSFRLSYSTIMLLMLVSSYAFPNIEATTVIVTNAAGFQQAIANLSPGTTIVVNSSTGFSTNVPILIDKLSNVSIVASSSRVLIDCNDQNVRGLAIRSSQLISISGIDVTACRFGGIVIQTSSDVTVSNSEVYDTVSLATMAAIDAYPPVAVYNNEGVTLDNIHVHDNISPLFRTSGIEFSGCDNCMLRNSQSDHNSGMVGSGLFVGASMNFTLNQVSLNNNKAVSSGALAFFSSTGVFDGLTVQSNTAQVSGIGSIQDATVLFVRSLFTANQAESDDSGFEIKQSNVTIECSTLNQPICVQGACRSLAIGVDGEKIVPDAALNLSIPVCFNGMVYINGIPQFPQECQDQPKLTTVTLVSTIITSAGGSSGLPLIALSGYTSLIGELTELVSDATALQIANGAEVALTNQKDRVQGGIVCLGSGSISSVSSDTCGASNPCQCDIVSTGVVSGQLFCPVVSTGTTVGTDTNGTIIIIVQPSNPNGTVIITPGSSNITAPPGIVSPIVNVTGNGTNGATITLLTNITHGGDYCLAFFNEVSKTWECVDECLDYNYTANGTYVSGFTPHFTNFAVLLAGNGCSSFNYPLATYIALGSAAGISILIILSILYLPFCHRFSMGDEAIRVERLRTHTKKISRDDGEDEITQQELEV